MVSLAYRLTARCAQGLLAEGAVGDLADYFRYEFVSTHSLIQKAAI
jgi:hypothetical protein